jgi:hypothetical protein
MLSNRVCYSRSYLSVFVSTAFNQRTVHTAPPYRSLYVSTAFMPICIGLWQAERGVAASLVTLSFTALLICEVLAFWKQSIVLSLLGSCLATSTRICMNLLMWPHKEKLTVMQQTYWAMMVSSYFCELALCATYVWCRVLQPMQHQCSHSLHHVKYYWCRV